MTIGACTTNSRTSPTITSKISKASYNIKSGMEKIINFLLMKVTNSKNLYAVDKQLLTISQLLYVKLHPSFFSDGEKD